MDSLKGLIYRLNHRLKINSLVNCGLFLVQESMLWLQKISDCLKAKTSIRHPYKCEIIRSMPFEVMKLLKDGIMHSRKEDITKNVIYCANRKAHVLSFTSKDAGLALLSLLSNQTKSSVQSKFKKNLKGRVNGKAAVIISLEKDFAFIYKIKTSQLTISFRYGVWNKAGFPLHN